MLKLINLQDQTGTVSVDQEVKAKIEQELKAKQELELKIKELEERVQNGGNQIMEA